MVYTKDVMGYKNAAKNSFLTGGQMLKNKGVQGFELSVMSAQRSMELNAQKQNNPQMDNNMERPEPQKPTLVDAFTSTPEQYSQSYNQYQQQEYSRGM